MKCISCGMENPEGSRFCGGCGIELVPDKKAEVISDILVSGMEQSPAADNAAATMEDVSENATTVLTSELKTPGVNASDESESATTVLTSELKTPGVNASDESESATTVLTGNLQMNQAPAGPVQGFAPVMPQMNANPAAQPAPGTAPMPAGEDDGKKSKKSKKVKEKKQKNSSGMGIGTKVYIICSIIVMVVLAGMLIYLYITQTKDIEDRDAKIKSMNLEVASYTNAYDMSTLQIENLSNENDSLYATIDEDEETIASLQDDLNDYEESSDYYSGYNGLITFGNSTVGQGNEDFFASDSVIHLGTDVVSVYVYVSENTDIQYVSENGDVASCEWDGWLNEQVAILNITPGTTIGNTTITLTNAENDESINIYVYNE